MAEMNYYESLKAGLEDVVAFLQGDTSRCRVIIRESPVPEYKAQDVVQIRESLNLSQNALASVLGVPVWTVEEWEAGDTVPSGPARHLLYLIEGDHSLADKLKTRQVSSDQLKT